MGTCQGRMAVGAVLLWALLHFTLGMAQVRLQSKAESDQSGVPIPRVLDLSHTRNLNEGMRLDVKNNDATRIQYPMGKMFLPTNFHPQKSNTNGEVPERKHIFKREAKKPKNTMRRKKFSKKKLEQKAESESETESENSDQNSETEEQESSETAPESYTYETESDTSEEYEDSKYDLHDSSNTHETKSSSSESESTSSSNTHETKSKSSTKYSSKSEESNSDSTSSISLTTEEKRSKESSKDSDEVYSGPDSSPPASSDSTDESSASKYISGDSSEISYTMSSSAEDAFPTSSSESRAKKSEQGDSSNAVSKHASKSDEQSKIKSKSENKPKGKKIVKKITEISIKLDENKLVEGTELDTLVKEKNIAGIKHLGANIKENEPHTKEKDITGVKKIIGKVEMLPQNMRITTERVLRMIKNCKNEKKTTTVNKANGGKSNERIKMKESKERMGMEMMKVKKAVDSQKKEDLEHDLNRDYPSGTVEIENWEGTFAPIVGEPYVAPVHHQPDSFWDAIYRSTDPDLPTQPGADLSVPESTPHPNAPTIWNHPFVHPQTDIKHFAQVEGALEAKNKDKGGKKKDKKKPKLTPKEKKQKKREKKDQKSGTKLSAKTLAAGKSEETMKTPSEEERESGTTYKPEGAYQYPSFRHPDFNPDTAYDENGIPIHESPGWSPPPTLPGDHRFGKERSRAGAGLSHNIHQQPQDYKLQQLHNLHVGLVAQEKKHPQDDNHLQLHDVHADLVAQEHHHQVAEALNGIFMEHVPKSNQQPQDHNHLQLGDVHADLLAEEGHNHGITNNNGKHQFLPVQHQEGPVKGNAIKHKIKKRKAAVSGSSESVEESSNVMTTKELNAAAKQHRQEEAAKEYKTYKLTDVELMNKEDSAPLEALNPALYMHRNMLQAKKKPEKHALPKLSESTEVIAVIVSPQDGHMLPAVNRLRELHKIHKVEKPSNEEPTAYSRHNEAMNPALYKHRNMFKVNGIKEDGMKVNQDMLRAIAMKNVHKQGITKTVPLEEFLKGTSSLKGRGRENFNPIFINPKKLFHVNTNKFNPTSIEHNIVKREVNPDMNTFKSHHLQKREPVYNCVLNGSLHRGSMG